MRTPRRIVLDRTDGLGDAVLALPLAGLLRRRFPDVSVWFLGRSYTRPLVECCEHVDGFLDWESVAEEGPLAQRELLQSAEADAIVHLVARRSIVLAARAARIPVRIGHARRVWGVLGPNRWVLFSKKRSRLHETQLNCRMLGPLGLREVPSLGELGGLYGLARVPELRSELAEVFEPGKVHVVISPGTTGNAPGWGLDRYAELGRALDPGRYRVVVTGQSPLLDAAAVDALRVGPHVVSLVDRLSLRDLIAVIARAEALVAASTGPLHVAAALGRRAIGLYGARPTKGPWRWGPLGPDAHALVHRVECARCARGEACDCVREIGVEEVVRVLEG